jgi:hypothetical protein
MLQMMRRNHPHHLKHSRREDEALRRGDEGEIRKSDRRRISYLVRSLP